MRYALLLPLFGLGLVGCAAPTPPTTTTTTYHPATTETVVTQPASGYASPGTSTSTTVIRQQ